MLINLHYNKTSVILKIWNSIKNKKRFLIADIVKESKTSFNTVKIYLDMFVDMGLIKRQREGFRDIFYKKGRNR